MASAASTIRKVAPITGLGTRVISVLLFVPVQGVGSAAVGANLDEPESTRESVGLSPALSSHHAVAPVDVQGKGPRRGHTSRDAAELPVANNYELVLATTWRKAHHPANWRFVVRFI
jgi:hypothetical protein